MSLRAPAAELEGESMSTDQTLAVLRSTITQIKNQLEESNTSVTAHVHRSPSYLTSHLKYQIQSPKSFTEHVEECYTSQGYLINNPTVLTSIKSSLPSQLLLATFDTRLLLAKNPTQVVSELQQARDKCSLWEKAESEVTSDNPNCGERDKKSICVSPVQIPQEAFMLHTTIQEAFPKLVESLSDSLQDINNDLIVRAEYINDIGYTMDRAAATGGNIRKLTQQFPLNYSLITETWMMNEYVHQISRLIAKSVVNQLQNQPNNQINNQIRKIQRNVKALASGLESMTSQRQIQVSEQGNLLKLEQQLQRLERQQQVQQQEFNDAQVSRLETDLKAMKEEGSALADEAFERWEEDLMRLNTSIQELQDQVHNWECLNATETVVLWPTNIQLKVSNFLTYSIYNFYAAVVWGWIMVLIFLYTCYLAAKRDHRLTTLEDEARQLRQQLTRQLQKRRAKATTDTSAPLLRTNAPSKKMIVTALNKTASRL